MPRGYRASRLRPRSSPCRQLTAENRSENAQGRRFAGRCNGTMLSSSREIADREERMTAHLSPCRLLLAAAAFALGQAMPGDAAELNPAALTYKLPDQIKWNPPSAAG